MTLESAHWPRALLALCALLPAGPSGAQSSIEMTRFQDTQSGLALVYPKQWRLEQPAGGPVKLVLGEPVGSAFIVCNVEYAAQPSRLPVLQRRVDRDLVEGFKTRDWPQQLAGRRNVLDFQVREIGGVPMGAIDWDGTEQKSGQPAFARGIKVFRMTPAAVWTAECAAMALSKPEAEARFGRQIDLIAEIINSVRFPRGRDNP